MRGKKIAKKMRLEIYIDMVHFSLKSYQVIFLPSLIYWYFFFLSSQLESVWKTVPSEARVTRDVVSGLQTWSRRLSGRQYQLSRIQQMTFSSIDVFSTSTGRIFFIFLSIDILISLCSSLCDDHKRSKKHGLHGCNGSVLSRMFYLIHMDYVRLSGARILTDYFL